MANYLFWEQLPRPFFTLAPMADVSDAPFRAMIAKYSRHGELNGGPDIFWNEFVSCDGLQSDGRETLMRDFAYTENEHPIIAQIFGSVPDNFYKTAQLIKSLGFDGVDINMGCPDKSVEKQGAGSSLIKNPELAKDIINATIEGAGDMPVSVKTRLGYNKRTYDEWVPVLLDTGIKALTVHARTRKEMSNVPATWEDIKEIVKIAKGSNVLIIGNGDALHIKDAQEKAEMSGADGVMLGRAVFGNPWLFDKNITKQDIPLSEQFRVMIEHTYLFEKELGNYKNFAIMKKHFKAYVTGFDGAKELRIKLMDCANAQCVEQTIQEWEKKN